MIRLSYVSDATRPMTGRDLDEILAASRLFNSHHGLTGLLVHVDGRFLQVVEGEPSSVAEVMARVRASSRHDNVREAAPVEVSERRFPHWAMGFESTLNQDVVDTMVVPLMEAGALSREEGAKVLLARFSARTGLSADGELGVRT